MRRSYKPLILTATLAAGFLVSQVAIAYFSYQSSRQRKIYAEKQIMNALNAEVESVREDCRELNQAIGELVDVNRRASERRKKVLEGFFDDHARTSAKFREDIRQITNEIPYSEKPRRYPVTF